MLKRLSTRLWVHDYDAAVTFFTQALGFILLENTTLDAASGKRWVRLGLTRGGAAELLLVLADTPHAAALVGQQGGNKVWMVLETDDIARDCANMQSQGVQFLSLPTQKPHGTVAVFLDISGNRWDLVQATLLNQKNGLPPTRE